MSKERPWFTCLIHNPAYPHLDEAYCREHTEFDQRNASAAACN